MRALLEILASKTVLLAQFLDGLITSSGAKIEAGVLLPAPSLDPGISSDAAAVEAPAGSDPK